MARRTEPAQSAPAARAADAAPQWPADRVERWPLDRLIPSARNARTHSDAQIAQLAASMREWGWTMPVLVDEDGGLLAGHGRVLAGRQLGFTSVPTMVARGWSDAQKRAYMIADNKLSLNAGWNEEMLRVEIDALAFDGYDTALTGFSTDELAELAWTPKAPKVPVQFEATGSDLKTDHRCPKCGYEWSGASR
ncbi:hypothetical protein OKW45_001968 [Paraburkholderia sp. WSM4175]|uniref:ParB/Srx family N-terminal domain-containing protein n=1 Tax=Paraburkholderia sp. WSM4175 TaxID=2991072 RepID=UPI003D1B7E45